MSRLRLVATTLLVLGMAVASCGGDSGDGPLVIYSGRSEDLVAPVIDAFAEETGIEVDVRYGDSTELAATLLQEGETTEADVFFAQDPASLGAASELMAVLPDELLAMVPNRFADRDGRWIGTSGRVRVVVYDSETVDEADLPSSIDDVLDPRWEGRIGVAPTNGSFLAFVAAMILERGEDATLAWLEQLADLQPIDYPKNSPIVDAADSGEVALGLVNHYYLLRAQAEGAGTRAANHFLTAGDAGSLVMPAGAGILEGTDREDAARSFIEYLLSEETQTYFATETFEYPLVPGVSPVAALPDIETIPTPDIDLSELADVLDRATDLVAEAGLL
jgi:iron(III) transport system substrate-binding protein